MHSFRRVALIVLDSVGIGELPDAQVYGDTGTNTLSNIAKYCGGISLPHLTPLGLGNIGEIQGISQVENTLAYYGKMAEMSRGKDTTTGHWEMMGVHTSIPFRTYPNGFPKTLVNELETRTGRKVLGNKVASGTEIIKELGEAHLRTGGLIVYTSADSVLQIAAHKEYMGLDELYKACEIARELTLQEDYLVVRVIARPFIGEVGCFKRTSNRKDYSISPPSRTVLDILSHSMDVIGIGKISDIFAGEGITQSISTKSNMDGVNTLIRTLDNTFYGLVFANLVDFDSQFGHRRDVIGYKKALEAFDSRVPEIIDALEEDDLLIITADHGNDPTHHGTDHTREYVPLLVYGKKLKEGSSLGVRKTFSDVGATIADIFSVQWDGLGCSFLPLLK